MKEEEACLLPRARERGDPLLSGEKKKICLRRDSNPCYLRERRVS